MIPRLSLQSTAQPNIVNFLQQLAKTPFTGEIRGDFVSRLIAATDNSIYQILPQAVVFPRTQEDLRYIFQLSEKPEFANINFSPRGGGTGTNGQSLSTGIVIDCSKYMNQILELNLEAGWVRVQPGVILDQLNIYLKPYGVFFAPNVAPSNRATIGGMINTDGCGKGSRIYGRTSSHIIELTWILADGTMGRSQSLNSASLSQLKQGSDSLGKIYRQVDDIVTSKGDLIADIFPKMARFMTGYNLAKVYSSDEDTFNLNWILAGSEGTLAVITEAKLKLTKIPQFKQLLALHYNCFDDALQAASTLLASAPGAIETIDEKILALAQQDEIYYYVKDFIGDAQAINLVEFVADTDAEIEEKVNRVWENLAPATGYYLATQETEISRLWELRKKGVGLLGNQSGRRKPIAFIEDTAVPPACLASYIPELKALLTAYQLDYAMYGHVDVGCLHVRPALDMKVPEDEALIRELSDKVVALVRKYGGVMWGEHGKGFRSEYTPLFFGEELYEDLRRIKAAFDPHNKLNPGKIVTPFNSEAEVVQLEAPLRGHFDRQVSPLLQQAYQTAFNCNGNGACFNFHGDDVMCPSYKGMNNRIHSPKGRASLLREWLRQLSLNPERQITQSNILVKLWNSWQSFTGVEDYSHDVYAGMHGCLSCKACATQCPIHVNIPEMKSQFLELYHSRYLRHWRDYLIADIEAIAQWQSYLPRLTNFITLNPLSRWFTQHFFALVDIPGASEYTIKQGLLELNASEFDLTELSALDESARQRSIILLQDAFTSFYDSQIVIDTYAFLTSLGYSVHVAPFFPNGKLLHLQGFLDKFRAIALGNAHYLQQLGKLGIPIVGIEPSITLTYRDEYRKYVLDVEIPQIYLLQEFLNKVPVKLSSVTTNKTYYLYGHCTEKTSVLESGKQWQKIFQAFGLELIPVSVGCCGMAGIYGHEAEHYDTSKDIYQLSWAKHLPSNPEERQYILATGYSCRSQLKRFAGWTPLHPIQVLSGRSRGAGSREQGSKCIFSNN
ncbi:FAD-binding and (Fe-S)-binding domain-containing protein [Calothrix rhizosoleniae]|uniref:FAD-binding and (Fe-S)-binding domain-containing protein n=1 Tax=Calothrix rhizosoleniae TaxID=888997 RepID=UPI000B497635|nr:FAD-binding and (Fe-S)-binding domain-containing protein [Calothrix rhizosoleniae]